MSEAQNDKTHSDLRSSRGADRLSEWESLADVLVGFRPEQVESLVAARDLELVYPLLHALTRGGLAEFFVRVAALESLLSDGRSPLKPQESVELLYWLKEPESVLRTLRESGWIEHEPGGGYRITDAGRFVATVLSFLRARVREQVLLPTIEGVDYMLRCGVDPVRQLVFLRSQLEDLRSAMEVARNSHSSVLLRDAAGRLDQALDLSERIRTVLAKVPLELQEARSVAQDIHDLLSRLHGVGSELHSAITEVGRQYLSLVAGLSATDIVAALMRLPLPDLARAAADVLFPTSPPPPLITEELVAAQAEAYLARQIGEPTPTEWSEPPQPEDADAAAVLPVEVIRLIDDLDRLVAAGVSATLNAFVPKKSPPESLLRASLLPLVRQPTGGAGVAGRLGALPLAVIIEEDGYPRKAPAPLVELTPGKLEPVGKEYSDG
jgi:hypothetical protein